MEKVFWGQEISKERLQELIALRQPVSHARKCQNPLWFDKDCKNYGKFCEEPAIQGSSYCEAHHKVNHLPTPEMI